jgi:hypothetical protein
MFLFGITEQFSSLTLEIGDYIMLMEMIPIVISNLANFDEPAFSGTNLRLEVRLSVHS